MKSKNNTSFRAPPNPPKFLVVTGVDSKTSIVKIEKIDDTFLSSQAKTPSTKSTSGLLSVSSRSSFKNSKTDSKANHHHPHDNISSKSISEHHVISSTYFGVKPRGAPIAPPKTILPSSSEAQTTSFLDDHRISYDAKPRGVADHHRDDKMMLMMAVGPDNPAVNIDEIWSAYWDDIAGAVYYYNHETGEATWIPPDLSSS